MWKLPPKEIDGSGTTIALLDSGINYASPAFKRKIIAIKNFVPDDVDCIIDSDGHGTLCAGIATGLSFYCPMNINDPKTVSLKIPPGVAPGAKLIICRVAKANESSTDMKTFIDALEWLKDNYTSDSKMVNVISISLLWSSFSSDMAKVISELTNKGVIIVCCAANEGMMRSDSIQYPARLGNVLCIGSHDRYGKRSPFSSVGRGLDFLAPGENILGPGTGSNGPFSVTCDSGTSYSTPAVAGLICLILHDVSRRCDEEKELTTISMKSLKEHVSNMWVMRELLKVMSTTPGHHSYKRGYGPLEPRKLFDCSTQHLVQIVKSIVDADTID